MRMLSYLYMEHRDFQILDSDTDITAHWKAPDDQLFLNARVVAIADYYQIQDLKDLAARQFSDLARQRLWAPNTAKGLMELAQACWVMLPPEDMTLKAPIKEFFDRHKLALCRDPEVLASLERGGDIVSALFSVFAEAHDRVLTTLNEPIPTWNHLKRMAVEDLKRLRSLETERRPAAERRFYAMEYHYKEARIRLVNYGHPYPDE